VEIPWLEVVTIGVYLVFLVVVGVIFSTQNKNSEDYFKSGSKGTWWLVGINMFMAGISAYTFVGNAVGIYQSGWSPLAIYGANILSLLVCFFGLAAMYRQLRVVTIAEVVRMRFGKRTEQLVAYIFVINNMIWSGLVLYGLAVFTQRLFPQTPAMWVIISVGLIVSTYCTIGGNWGILANSFVQGLIMISMTVLVAILCFIKVGGICEFFGLIKTDPLIARQFRLISPENTTDGFWAVKYGITWFIFTAMAQFTAQTGIFQSVRYFAAKDGNEARKASLFAAGLMAVGAFIWFIPPMTSRLLYSAEVMASHPNPLKAPEFAYVIASQNLLPAGLVGLMVVAMFSASVSSMDVGLNRNAAMLVRDMLPIFRRRLNLPEWTDAKQIAAGKVVTFILGMLVTAMALFYSQMQGLTIFDLLLNVIAFFMLPLLIPMILCLFFKRTASWAVIASMLAGFVPSLLDKAFAWGLSYQGKGFIVCVCSVTAFLISTRFYKNSPDEYKQRCKEFYDRMHRPVDFEKEVGQCTSRYQLKTIGILSIVTGALLLLLLLIPNPLSGRLCILSVCAFILTIGIVMLVAGLKQPRINR
jgi:solute:Na+ symporter, SSS family